jgi:ATP-dependent DNA ligase
MREMRTRAPDETALIFFCSDVLHIDGVDFRALPLSERRKDLALCRKARAPFMKMTEQFPDGQILFQYACAYGFEGVVSKRLASRYSSGPSRWWSKVKSPQWRRDKRGALQDLREAGEADRAERARPHITEAQGGARPRAGKLRSARLARRHEGRAASAGAGVG